MERKQAAQNEDISSLVQKIKDKDREAFMAVVRLYQKRVFLLAFSFFGNREDAMDIVQETFLRLYQKIDTFKSGKNFQSWVLQIAKNLCIDYYRKNYRKRMEWGKEKSVEELNLPVKSSNSPSKSADLNNILSSCVKKLAERQRLVFVMKHYNELKYEEIAQILSISLGTVKSLHFKAVQNLKSLVNPYLGIQA